ncbi:glycosyl transferase family 1 [Sphingobacteriaceae bacterium]|nr:glycosyl transferase family 1 [Sphingobacteriaceae bacterium]
MAPRVLLLADISSSHTEKWAIGLAKKGYHIGIFSLNKSLTQWYIPYQNIEVLYDGPQEITGSFIQKLSYVFNITYLHSCIKSFLPDLVHAHYASSYGLLGSLCGFSPFIISAWGSDIYEFPQKSFFHKAILKFNLKRADKILSTSYVMKGELWKYSSKEVDVIPFGVDTKVFYPMREKPEENRDVIRLGTIKAMEDMYGIKTIVEAVDLVKKCMPDTSLRVYLIGAGKRSSYYKKMIASKNLQETFVFTGKISYTHIATYHNLLDILLNVSTVNESFGVSVIEGMACGKPVIVSNSPGLKEVVSDIGIVVEKENAQQLAKAIMQLIESPELRKSLGKFGRQHVLDNYDFKTCIEQMTAVYDKMLRLNEKHPSHLQEEVGA